MKVSTKALVLVSIMALSTSFTASSEVLIENAGSNVGLANESVTYTFENLGEHRGVELNFDLFIFDSWDGLEHNDFFGLSVDGEEFIWSFRFSGTTSVYVNDKDQEVDTDFVLGNFNEVNTWGEVDRFYDDFYNGLIIPHSSETLTVTFFGKNLQSALDESWAVDNLSISTDDRVDITTTSFLLKDVDEPAFGVVSLFGILLLCLRKKGFYK